METSVEQAVASTLVYVYMMIHESSQKIRKEKGKKKKVQSRSIQSKPGKGRVRQRCQAKFEQDRIE